MTVRDSGGEVATQTTDLNVDGYYFNAVKPVRVLDTRQPIGVPTIAKVAPGGVVRLKLAGTNGIPADAGAVALNVTVAGGTSNGFVTVYPDATAAPNSSNLNFAPGQIIPNAVVVKIGADGYVDFENQSKGSTDLLVDLSGLFEPGTGAQFVPLTRAASWTHRRERGHRGHRRQRR